MVPERWFFDPAPPDSSGSDGDVDASTMEEGADQMSRVRLLSVVQLEAPRQGRLLLSAAALVLAAGAVAGAALGGPLLAALRVRLQARGAPFGDAIQAEALSCEDAAPGDSCWSAIMYAREQPLAYGGLTSDSPPRAFQQVLHNLQLGGCPAPCAREMLPAALLAARGQMAVQLSAPKPPPTKEDAIAFQIEGAIAHEHQDQPCRDVDSTDPCYAAVTWALDKGIYEHPDWYTGTSLTRYSGFLDAQAVLHKLGRGNCPMPCTPGAGDHRPAVPAVPASPKVEEPRAEQAAAPAQPKPVAPAPKPSPALAADKPVECADAHIGDAGCYTSVSWAKTDGIYAHPEWYPNLDQYSSIFEFQAALFKQGKGNCTAPPCTRSSNPMVKPEVHSIFCFSFVVLHSQEEGLVRLQFNRHIGIFACDAHAVISSEKSLLGSYNGVDEYTWENKDAKTKDSWHNSEVFASTWKFVIDNIKPWNHDWIVKADSDTVWFPDRLRQHLAQHAAPRARQFFANCNVPQGSSKLYGALEVYSRDAIKAYSTSWELCQKASDWTLVGEDLYMERCMEMIDVVEVGEFTLVGDGRCNYAPCTDGGRVAFHPFKDEGSFTQCLQEAQR